MDVIQTFAYKSEQFIPFGLKRTTEHDIYCGATRTKAHILELIYSHHCDVKLYMEQSILADLTTFMPSYGIPKNAPMIFNRATKPEQDQILVDFHLMPEELKITNERIAIVNTCWSPFRRKLAGKHYLAYLTNFGGCEIRQKHTAKRSWSIVVHDIAKEWMLLCQKNLTHTITSFQGLEDAVHAMQIKAISWNNLNVEQCHNNDALFSFITADGTIAFCGIGDEQRFIYQTQIDCRKVNGMEWFSFYDRKDRYRSFIITSDLNGLVKLFAVHSNSENITDITEITKITEIFTEFDGIPANGIHWEYLKNTNRLFIVFCKTMHIFVYLVNIENGKLLSTHTYYVGHSTINGITRKNPMEYIVGTLSGHIECLKISIKANNIIINSEAYKQLTSHTKYALYGISTSTNNAFLLFAFFAGRPYDHLVLREPANVTVCSHLSGLESLNLLQSNPTKSLAHCHDLAEAVLCAQLKNDKLFRDYIETPPDEIECNNDYLYSLKIRLIVTSARSTYLRQKNRMIESGNLLGEYDIAKRFIFAIQSYQVLSLFKKTKTELNALQLVAAQCHRFSLRDFIELSIFDEYDVIKKRFHPAIESILSATECFDGCVAEGCSYCEEPIEFGKNMCNDEHDLTRCCITRTQVPLMNQQQCVRCQLVAIDDMDILKLFPNVSEIDGDLICPLCDLPMERPHLTFYNYED